MQLFPSQEWRRPSSCGPSVASEPEVTSRMAFAQSHGPGESPAGGSVGDKVEETIVGQKLVGILGMIELLRAAFKEIVAIVEFNAISINECPNPITRIVAFLGFPGLFPLLLKLFWAHGSLGQQTADAFHHCIV